MSRLGKLWAGRLYGTNTGNLFVEFDEVEPRLSGTLRFRDSDAGTSVYKVEGTFDDHLALSGHWTQGGKPETHGELEIEGQLRSDGSLSGTWNSSVGTGGTFGLYPHDHLHPASHSASDESVPEQVYSRNVAVGAIKLYTQDVLDLLHYIQSDFSAPRPIVTYRVRESEVTKYADQFIKEISTLGRLSFLKIAVQEPDLHGINRHVVVEFQAFGTNEIRVQGTQESWVVGKSETLATFLRKHQSNLVTSYRKFGLNINAMIFFAMLIVIPEIGTLGERLIFVSLTIGLLLALLWIHSRFIPNATLELTAKRPNWLVRAWPTILSWVVAASASLVAALVFQWLTKGGP